MAQFTLDGVVYEEMPNGQVKVVGHAQAPSAAPMTFGTPDPSIARKEARDAARDERDIRKDERDEKSADLDRQIKELEIRAAQVKTGGGSAGLKKVEQLVAQINRVQQLYDTSIGKTKRFTGAMDYLPTDDNARFDTAGAQLSQIGLAAFRTPGTGTVSDRDAIMFDKGNLPQASTRDASIEEILGGLRRRVEEEYEAAGQPAPQWSNAQQRADNEAPGQNNGAPLKAGTTPVDPGSMPPANGGGGLPPRTPWDQPNPTGGTTIATGPTRTIHSDRLSAQVDAMMNAGASKAMIDTVLKQQGFPPIDPSTFTAATRWMKDNPGQKYFGATIDREEPLGLMAQAAGSAPGAFMAQMADAATAGTVGALAGDKGQGALDAMDQTYPGAAMAGSIVGGITGAGAAEAGLVARAPGALARYAPRIADALYGGLSGFNGAKDGQGAQGAAMGAGLGVLGGAAGDGVMRVAGAATRGVTDPAVQYLRERGVPMTVGQIAGQGGFIGRGVKKIEDAMTSIPGVGNMIDARRMEGLEGFNRAAFDIGAETTGGQVQDYGAAGLGQLRDAVGRSYDNALGPVRIDATEPALINDLGAVRSYAQAIPNVNGAQDAALAGIDARVTGAIDPNTGTMSGRGFQEAYRGLARTGRERANGDYGHEIGAAMRQGQDALAGALERQNPGAYQGFADANQANRRMNVLADAVGKAKNQEDQMFTPAQLNMADDTSATRLTGKVNASMGNRPFAQLGQAGQAVLPSKLPDSGTATRALVGAGLTGAFGGGGAVVGGTEGAATGTGLGLGATLALMLGGTRGAQQAANRLLLDRPDLAVRIGESLQRNARIGGGLGAGASLGLGLQGLVAGE